MEENDHFISKNLIITQKPDIALSKLQKLFNSLIQKIEKLKSEKFAAKKQIDLINVRVMRDFAPLEIKLIDKKVDLVYLLDKQYSDSFFKKRELEKLSYLIKRHCYILINQHSKDNLKDIFNRHSEYEMIEISKSGTNQASLNNLKQMFSELLGIEFEENADIDTEEKLNAYIENKMGNNSNNFSTKNDNKKTAKQLQKEVKVKQEEKNISKIARAIYTELVKEFHPDLEQDEAERAIKNGIMHQITEAYRKNDLFKLLQLKLDLLIGANDKLIVAEEQLKYYNKILKQQLNELEGEVWALIMHPHISRFGGQDNIIEKKFATELNYLKQNVRELENDLKLLIDKQNMRMFLRDFEIDA